MARITLNTDQVSSIATEMEKQNEELLSLLQESQTTIENLLNTNSGEAIEASVEAYREFANKYFADYHDVVAAYVDFLRRFVVEGYTETETANVNLSSYFK